MSYPRRTDVDTEFSRLLSRSYGMPTPRPARSTRAVALSADTGKDVLASGGDTFEEYVVERGEPPVAAASPAPAPAPSSPAAGPSSGPPTPSAPDAGPSGATSPSAAATPAAPTPSPAPAPTPAPDPVGSAPARDPYAAATTPAAPPAGAAGSAPSAGAADSAPAAASGGTPATAAASAPAPAPPADGASARPVSDDDLAADMQAILSGAGVYDPEQGRVRERTASPPPPPAPIEKENEGKIFDRIAESMAYANAFDLGTVELNRRFNAFDRASTYSAVPPAPYAERAPARPAPAPAYPSYPAYPPAAPVGAADRPGPREFYQDLSVIEESRLAAFPLWSALSSATDAGSSARIGYVSRLGAADLIRPFFDTGEHVRAGDEAGVVPLPVNGVDFTYGEIVAIPDFYASPEDLIAAGVGELQALRTLIRRSADHYRAGTGTNPVTDKDWGAATGGRYLDLAAGNYAHFSPVSVIQESFPQRETDNRARFSQLHQQALRESQRLHLAHPNATPTLESALVINAFADHFLTDAFASGHLVNKELVLDRFHSGFYNSANELTAAAEAFFARVAAKAFTGRVRERFSKLEEATPTLGIGGVGVRLNIDTPRMFTALLQRAATRERDKVANVAVKVLHDHLNAGGVMVTNGAGAAPWLLHGDEALDATTLGVMRQAVAQSVGNLSDPSLLASGVDLAAFVERVWRFVPVPTAASLSQLRTDIQTYTNPASTAFSDATAALILQQADALADQLVAAGHLRPA